MKLPLSWLKKYIDISKLSAEKMEEMLTMSGSKVEALEKHGAEAVIEIEVTTNRPDCLSILGLAHEVSALTGKRVSVPKSYFKKETAKKAGAGFSIEIESKKACPLYTARLIQNVSIKPAPEEAKKFLELVGVRAISNVVDATNFVLFESGQPLHAFDFDKIKGGKIVVRYARKDEKFLGIDGIEYTLDEKTLVIADAERPIAIAGVIGGKLTEVSESTQNILLESASFDPALVRQASRKYKLSTDSSYRFERGTDPHGVARASRRAKDLILEWAGGEDVSGLVQWIDTKSVKKHDTILRVERVEKILGIAVSQKRILKILASLSLEARAQGKTKITVKRSTFRRDITREEDLIEEILRIEGFDKIPVIIPPTRYQSTDPQSLKAARIPEIKKFLAALGFSEVITYSLVSAKSLTGAGFDLNQAHRVVNTTGAGQEYFRPSLLSGMLEATVFNIHRKSNEIKVFEVGNCYQDGREETRLALLMYGSFENHWGRRSEVSFYDLKGIVQNLLHSIGLKGVKWSQEIATVSQVPSQVLSQLGIPGNVYYAEVKLDTILSEAGRVVRVKPVPKYPGVRRDLALIVDEKFLVQDLEECMKLSAKPLLQEVTLFDQYIGKNIPTGKRSLAFSLSYQKEDGTFTDHEIQSLQERVGQALKERFAVEFR